MLAQRSVRYALPKSAEVYTSSLPSGSSSFIRPCRYTNLSHLLRFGKLGLRTDFPVGLRRVCCRKSSLILCFQDSPRYLWPTVDECGVRQCTSTSRFRGSSKWIHGSFQGAQLTAVYTRREKGTKFPKEAKRAPPSSPHPAISFFPVDYPGLHPIHSTRCSLLCVAAPRIDPHSTPSGGYGH